MTSNVGDGKVRFCRKNRECFEMTFFLVKMVGYDLEIQEIHVKSQIHVVYVNFELYRLESIRKESEKFGTTLP